MLFQMNVFACLSWISFATNAIKPHVEKAAIANEVIAE